ncbi:hypothetical protein Nepgr_017335 [Nepenthes gracilis]|uniref:Uncharacterized protein n=1 Tax=Nepenthes gracilis TaxID=150966 RepID=A0AAD3XT02_NEPGR|nr:hypothetical protein Nepgr_017335 [Nepenthes gracilis]
MPLLTSQLPMQRSSSLLCSSNSLSSSAVTLLISRRFSQPFQIQSVGNASRGIRTRVRSNHPQARARIVSPLYGTDTKEIVETSTTDSNFIEIGYVNDVHGLKGEICVKHNTGFPELRFSKPGKRWLRQQVFGREEVQEVDLVSGRGHRGQKCWIVKFDGIDNVDQAKLLVGATLLVRENDRPKLEEGEFYTRDLVGMRVILKETGEPVGTVNSVYNYGASDLLHVMLDSSMELPQQSETVDSAPLVWIPFVDAIVPDVDMNKRELHITPPMGLLQLNLRSGERTKKERRLLEWKEKKKFQRLLIAAKKKLCMMDQQHVFHGFRFGEKFQRSLLAHQIVSVNSKLLQQALQNIEMSFEWSNLTQFINAVESRQITSNMEISKDRLKSTCTEMPDAYSKLRETGLDLITEGKLATVLLLKEGNPYAKPELGLIKAGNAEKSSLLLLEDLLCEENRFIEVWFLEEEKLPVVSNSVEEQRRHKILMKSPWEMLQSPIGSGGILVALSSNSVMEDLFGTGMEYVELCSIDRRCVCGSPVVVGFVKSCKADIGILTTKGAEDFEDNFHMIISAKLLKKMTKHIDKLQFRAVPKPNSHVEKVDKEWVDFSPSSANSYEFQSSIYNFLCACSHEKVCVVKITQ